MTSLYDRNAGPRMPSRTARALPKSAEKVLDCPGLVDDYYLNLLDWSSTNVVPPSPHVFSSTHCTHTSLCLYHTTIDINGRSMLKLIGVILRNTRYLPGLPGCDRHFQVYH